jgi:ABC-type multidrug transport system fused ATPase/permease subunit
MVSFERAYALSKTEGEAPRERHKDEILKSSNWPSDGEIVFRNFHMRYRDETELVLKGIDLHILGREKVGIVGRTGSGKSSLTLCLFRIIEGYSGSIEIDNVNIAEIGLDILRKKIWMIPQDPTLFEGNLRYNLDPYNEATDEQLTEALKNVDFYPDENILDFEIRASGDNLSVG